MIVIICAVAAMVIFLWMTIKDFGFEWGTFFMSFLVGLGGLLAGLLIVLFASAIFSSTPIEDCKIVETDKVELVALKDNFQIKGSAFLFSSVVDESLKYTYIYETDMGLTTQSVRADNAYIKYIDENETPYIQTWEVRPHSNFIYHMFCPGYYRYTIYLPHGSVIENVYEVDLE
jgi:hypothetical protein